MNVQKGKRMISLGAIFLALIVVYTISVFPPSGDDFNRLNKKDQTLIEYVEDAKGHYENLNGRILGNITSYIFIERLPRTIIKTVFLGLYFFFMMKLVRDKSFKAFIVVSSGFIMMPNNVFRQVLGWSAGFYNYFPPMVFILILITRLIGGKDTKVVDLIINFVLTFVSCLYLENLTIYLVFLPLAFAFTFDYKNKKALATVQSASLLGALLMFSSPVYRKVLMGDDDYRSFETGNLGSFIQEKWQVFEKNMIGENYYVFIFLAVVLGAFLIYRMLDRNQLGIEVFSLGALWGIFILNLFPDRLVLTIFSIGLHIGFYISLIFIGLRKTEKSDRKRYYNKLLIFSCISMALTMGPLLIVNPVISRNFFTPSVINVVIIICLIKIYRREGFNMDDIAWEKGLGILTLGFLLVYAKGYSDNYQVYLKRAEIINQAIEDGESYVEVPQLPYPQLMGGQSIGSYGRYFYRERQEDVEIEVEE